MPGGSEFRLHQGFWPSAKTLARAQKRRGQKAASAKCCIFFVCICQKAGSPLPRKACFLYRLGAAYGQSGFVRVLAL